MCTEGERDHVRTQQERSHLQETSTETTQLKPPSSPPGLCDCESSLLFKAPSLWPFVTATLADTGPHF